MTIKEAWNNWSRLYQNIVLANKSRSAVESILLKKYGSSNILFVDQRKAYEIFTNVYTREMNVKVASILWHLIEDNLNIFVNNPFKSYDEMLPPEPDLGKFERTAKKPNLRDTSELPATPKKSGRQSEKVCKLDPVTLEVLDTYDSMTAAAKAIGSKCISNQIAKHQKAKGFYWCRANYVEDYREELRKKYSPAANNATNAKARANNNAVLEASRKAFNQQFNESRKDFEQQLDETVKRVLEKASDDELLAELQRRGWHGPIQLTKKIVL